MQVRNKIFPYPVINHDLNFSSYKNKDFALEFEPIENEQFLILKNAKFVTNSETINELYFQNKIDVFLIIECSNTVFRKSYQLSKEGIDIELRKTDFNERVDISMFACAKQSFDSDFKEADDDYDGIIFEIEKYDIIGADDGFNVKFIHEENEESLTKSIFSIIIDQDLRDGQYRVNCEIGRKIAIELAKIDYDNYKVIYTVPLYKEVFFNMLLVPALIEALTKCKKIIENENKEIDDISDQYTWFRSIQSGYKRLKGEELTLDKFKEASAVQIAQELLGNPLGSALGRMVNEIRKIDSEGNENE